MKPPHSLKLVWQIVTLIRPDEWRRHVRWCAWCILVAAILNVPFAVTRLVHLRTPSSNPGGFREKDDIPSRWPSATPHDEPWPAPTSWNEWRAFGTRRVDASWRSPVENRNGFSMNTFIYGWPLPVLEHKQMWWDWSNPALKGPDHTIPTHIRFVGLILNPIIIGGGGYLLLIAPPLAFMIGRRLERRRQGLCTRCGCDMCGTESNICPECDTPRRTEAAGSV